MENAATRPVEIDAKEEWETPRLIVETISAVTDAAGGPDVALDASSGS